jgi:hypothetical protein
MIIFYGTKSSHVKSESSEVGVCPSCETYGQMITSVYANYAHVFWIPLFPLYKKVYATCEHCETVFELNEMAPDLRNQCVKFRRRQRFPLWHFTGIITVCCVILFGLLYDSNTSRQQNYYLANPQNNDVYVVQYDDEHYSTMKIVEITSDSIYFAENEYYADNNTTVETIDEDENYDYEELLSFTIEELKILKKERYIFSIKRKK